MSRLAVVLAVLAHVVLATALWVGWAMPAGCAPGHHIYGGNVCVSDATHIAPSSGVLIPVDTMGIDNRLRLRTGVVLTGVLAAGGLAYAARRTTDRQAPEPAAVPTH